MSKLQFPRRNQSFTVEEIFKLPLRDLPCLGFTHNGIEGVIQESHLTEEEFLSVPGMKESKWVFIRETHEWIPVFRFDTKENQPDVATLVDLEIASKEWSSNPEIDYWWATPKGFPRPQNE